MQAMPYIKVFIGLFIGLLLCQPSANARQVWTEVKSLNGAHISPYFEPIRIGNRVIIVVLYNRTHPHAINQSSKSWLGYLSLDCKEYSSDLLPIASFSKEMGLGESSPIKATTLSLYSRSVLDHPIPFHVDQVCGLYEPVWGSRTFELRSWTPSEMYFSDKSNPHQFMVVQPFNNPSPLKYAKFGEQCKDFTLKESFIYSRDGQELRGLPLDKDSVQGRFVEIASALYKKQCTELETLNNDTEPN